MPYIIAAVAFIAANALLSAYIGFRLTFYSDRKKESKEQYPLPRGACYVPYYDQLRAWMDEMERVPYENVSIRSHDGLTLRGRYYETAPGGPVEILLPGYHGLMKRDLCGAVHRCAELGHNALLVDQRANGISDGKVITFCNKEYLDCISWMNFVIDRFGPDVKVILTGISMGASTVLVASGEDLPKNVICIVADCGYTSPKQIIRKVMDDRKLPKNFIYPFVRLGGWMFGGFKLHSKSAIEAVKKSKTPTIFFHGTEDGFVPCWMSQENYNNCASEKKLVLTPGADHGMCYMVDKEGYTKALLDFLKDKI